MKVYLDTGADPEEAQPLSYGMSCGTCHTGEDFGGAAPRHYVAKVTFPGGMEIMNDEGDPDDSFLCMTCHQGRTGKGTIDEAIAADNLRFLNVHYLAAGASLYGSAAAVGYEYEGKTYAGKFNHAGNAAPGKCSFCHDVKGDDHSFHVTVDDSCTGCHDEATAGDVHTIRKGRSDDYDGDGDNTESLKAEIDGLATLLWAQIQQTASDAGKPILAGSGYPYFFNDLNDDGTLDPDEAARSNSYKSWTPALMKAVHNYQQSQKEPGAWAHNPKYTAQLLIDSIEDLGGDVSGLSRP